MRTDVQEALDRCLARLEAGTDIETCLRDERELAAELRPLLEAAGALREERRRAGEPSPAAFSAGRARMHAARAGESERALGIAGWLGGLARPAALAGVAALVAVVAAVGLTTDLFDFGATSTSAHVEGVVSRVDAGTLLLTTKDGQVSVSIVPHTVVLDADGQPVGGDVIPPGSAVRVEVEEEQGVLTAVNIEFEDDDDRGEGAEVEFSGVIQSVSGSTIELQASFGAATVLVDANTEVKGTLAAGVRIEVHATRQADGTYLAREIEVQGAGAEDDDDEDEDNSGPGPSGDGVEDGDSGSDDDNSGPGSTSSGSGGGDDDDDEHEDDD